MSIRLMIERSVLLSVLVFVVASCSPKTSDSTSSVSAPSSIGQSLDEQLRKRVEAVLAANATELPPRIQVEAINGNVSLSGSLDCEECGGMRTPGTLDTIQQSMGAIVRAVPGVESVNFELTTGP
jgi:osmotically-inducible protein OsmY